MYEAAKIIQKAYRSYKGRQKLEEQDKERAAAICIQNYYRRYKQVKLNIHILCIFSSSNFYLVFHVTHFTNFKKNSDYLLPFQYAYFKQMTHAAVVIQHGYRSYCAHKRFKKGIQENNQSGNNAVNGVGNSGVYTRAVRDSGKGSPGSLK